MNYAFRLSKHNKHTLEWDKCLYYDVETAKWTKHLTMNIDSFLIYARKE